MYANRKIDVEMLPVPSELEGMIPLDKFHNVSHAWTQMAEKINKGSIYNREKTELMWELSDHYLYFFLRLISST